MPGRPSISQARNGAAFTPCRWRARGTSAVRKAAATLAVDLASYQRTVLHVDYEEIARTDPEMSARVEKLIQSDQQLHAQLTGIVRWLAHR
ncbi:MAG: hypothetical protein L0211_22465 [Planctomycetaceae bacterium]|nr:hypothetical protein [Planctomycetaceae bacterium]